MATMPPTHRPRGQQSKLERGRAFDLKRANDPARGWYKTRAWQNRRAFQLIEYPLCARCHARGDITTATVVNHVGGHNGDYERFFWGPLESTCKPCHDGEIQREEARQRRKSDAAG